MRKLIVVVLLTTCLLALTLFTMRSERGLLALSHWAVASFTPYRMELARPSLKLSQGDWSAAEIHLYPADGSGPPFLSILDFRGRISLSDLLRGSLHNAKLRAAQVVLYVSTTDSTEDPDPVQWLEAAAWLPRELALDRVHLVTARRETLVFPLRELRAERVGSNAFSLSTEAEYDGEPLSLEAVVSVLQLDGDRAALSLQSRAFAPLSGSAVQLDGELRGTRTQFQYEFALHADYREIGEFLRGFGDRPALGGALAVSATMRGDATGFKLSDAQFKLDNSPHYRIDAAGSLDYHPADRSPKLVVEGSVSSVDALLDGLDLDLRPLGRARGSATITGTLQMPVIEQFVLRSESDSGLVVQASGRLEPAYLQAPGNELRLDLQGPAIGTLAQWTGALPYEPGPFVASARLRAADEAIALEDLVVEAGSRDTTWMRLDGRVDNIRGLQDEGLAAAQGLSLTLQLYSPDSSQLGDAVGLPLPPGFELAGNIRLLGSGALLRPAGGEVHFKSSDIELHLSPRDGDIRPAATPPVARATADLALSVSDTSALSQFTPHTIPVLGAVEGTGVLRQTAAGVALDDIALSVVEGERRIAATGAAENLSPLAGVALDTTFSGIDLAELLTGLLPDFYYEQSLGTLGGRANLSYRGGRWNLSDGVAASEQPGGPLELGLAISAGNLAGIPSLDGALEYHVRDPGLLDAFTGLRMNPSRGKISAASRPGRIALEGQLQTGDTRLDLGAELSHDGQALTGLAISAYSPLLHLDDLGLQAYTSGGRAYTPSERLDNLEPEARLERLLEASPRYPLDIALRADGIRGENTRINSLDIQLTGEGNRYTLRRFNVGYADTVGEVRGIIDLNARPPFVSLAGEAVGIPLSTLGRDLGLKSEVSGQLTVRGGLSAQGISGPSLLEDVDGSLAVALENGVFEGAAYDMLATDLLAWIYTGAAQETSTQVDCTMARFTLRDGVANSDDLYIETKQMVARGEAELDFVRQKMDVTITPLSRTRALQVPSSVRLKGPFDDPRTTVSPVAAAFDAYAELLALVPRLARKLFGVERRQGARQPCEARQ